MSKNNCKKIYAIYKNDTLLSLGTASECAELLNISINTVHFYASSIYKKRITSHPNRRVAESFYE